MPIYEPGAISVEGRPVVGAPTVPPGRIFGPAGNQVGIGEALASGFSNVTLVGPLAVKPLLRQFGINEAQLDYWHQQAQADPALRWMELGAEWLPEFAVGAGAWSVGRKLMVAGLARVAPQVLQSLGQSGAAATISGRFSELIARDQVSKVQMALGGPLEKQLADTLRLVGRVAGARSLEIPTPAILRATEIVGGGLGAAALGATDAIAEGKPLGEVARTAATWAAWSILPEAGLTVGAKALSKHFRANDPLVTELRARLNQPLQGARPRALQKSALRVSQAAREKANLEEDIAEAKRVIAGTEAFQTHTATNDVEGLAADWARQVAQGQRPSMQPTQAPSISTLKREAEEALEVARGKLPRARQEVAASKSANRAIKQLDVISKTWRANYLGNEAIGPRGKVGLLKTLEESYNRMLMRVAEAPQTTAKKLGVNGALSMHLVELSEVQSSQMQAVKTNLAHRALGTIRDGWRTKSTGQGGKFLLRAFHDRSKGGLRVALQNPDVADAAKVGAGIEELARNKRLTVQQLVRQGIVEAGQVGDAPPIVPRPDLSDDTFVEQWITGLMRLKGISRESATIETNSAMRRMGVPRYQDPTGAPVKRGILSFSEDVFEETVPPGTTLLEAVEAGLPVVDDPVAAYLMWERSAQRRLAHTRYFGPNYEVLDHLKESVALEGGYVGLYSEMMDAVLGRTYEQIADRRLASLITNTNIVTRMTLGVIPQLTQLPASAPLVHGLRSALIGVTKLANFGDDAFNKAVLGETKGLADTLVRQYREAALDPNFHTPGGKLADAIFHYSGFNSVERWIRLNEANIAKVDTVRTIMQAVEGRLRGRNYELAARRMDRLKVNLDEVVAKVRRLVSQRGMPQDEAIAQVLLRNGGELLDIAGWRGAQQVTFLSERSARPVLWNTPTGRVLTQFKNFAFQQARLVRDAVIKEAVTYGNMKPLAYFLSIYPVSGEFVGDVRSLFGPEDGWGRPDRSGLERVFNNMMAVGGFGIVSDMMVQASYGRFGEAILGPSAGDTIGFVNNVFQGHPERVLSSVQRLPAYRFVQGTLNMGAAGTEATLDAIKAGREYLGVDPEGAVRLEDLREFESARSR